MLIKLLLLHLVGYRCWDFIHFTITLSSYRAANTLRSAVETGTLMLCRKIVAFSSQSDIEPIKVFYEQNVTFSNVMRDGTKHHPVKPTGY